jgi:rubrerythrin
MNMTTEQAIAVLHMVEAHGLAKDAKALAIEALEAQRPGAWEWDSYYGGFYRCSACGYEQGRKTKYCPECGARMAEVTDDKR